MRRYSQPSVLFRQNCPLLIFLFFFQIKEEIINHFTKVRVNTLQEVTQIAQVVAMVTAKSDEISQDSQVSMLFAGFDQFYKTF